MATPLGTTFSTDDQVVAQGDVTFMEKIVESLVMEFNQTQYEEFLSFGSKSLRVERQYRKVSLEVRFQVPSETFPKMAWVKSVISGRIAREARVNVSHKTREVNVIEGQFIHALPFSSAPGYRGFPTTHEA